MKKILYSTLIIFSFVFAFQSSLANADENFSKKLDFEKHSSAWWLDEPRCPRGPRGRRGHTGPSGSLSSSFISSYSSEIQTIVCGADYLQFTNDTTTNGTITHGPSPYNSFTVGTSGTYLVAWTMELSNDVTDIVTLKLLINDVLNSVLPVNLQTQAVSANTATNLSGSYLINMNAGDSIGICIGTETPSLQVINPTISIFLIN
jgi:hypothetical protein